MKSTVEVLREARELISDPKRWTRGWFARDAAGLPVDAESADAVCWCGYGAIGKVTGGAIYGAASRALDAAVKALRTDGFAPLNDGPYLWEHADEDKRPRPAPARHRKVLAAFDKAIELSETGS